MSKIVDRQTLLQQILLLNEHKQFEELALEVFRYQAAKNRLYARFLELLSINPQEVHELKGIPFLPVSLFKHHIIKTGEWPSRFIFSSSGTTGQVNSQHHIRDEIWYRQISMNCFETYYGPVSKYCVLALLPSYLERSGSSLVFMVNEFIQASGYQQSGFFLSHQDQLTERLIQCRTDHIPVLLVGVSFALLDFAEGQALDLSHCIIMETGGMKGRRKEITRLELHQQLKKAFNVTSIHSEYGMTEMLSQAYSMENGLFHPGPSMRFFSRDITDPLTIIPPNRNGVLNFIDLANIDTCSFIATDDLGRVYEDGSFEVLGRVDNSDIRGCSLLLE